MPSLVTESVSVVPNPLDLAEQVMMDRDWAFDRPGDEELVAEVTAAWCNYRIWFTWQEDAESLIFSCALDTKLPKPQRPKIYPLLAAVNEKLWLGHFDVGSEDGTIMFRHALPLRGSGGATQEQIDDLLDAAINECERFYPAFQAVIWAGKKVEDALSHAIFETVGEA